ncbi:CGNR zinc finger domain-containing protein [Brevibacillus fluminis]|uniref:CGNR zinc finger domain-containing protein n=1 Tax=Brevibacillus fluminis TaxID=511487 RepID=UPI003F897B5D
MEWISLDFLNSDWRDWRGSGRRENRLEKAEWVEWFLAKWDLPAELSGMRDVRDLTLFRERLRTIVEYTVAGEPLRDADIVFFNEALQPYSSYPQLSRTENGLQLTRVSALNGWPYVTARIALDLAELLAKGDLRRLKMCDNPDCRWFFYDQSRNRAARWCDDKCCGNLMKVRRFREKNR